MEEAKSHLGLAFFIFEVVADSSHWSNILEPAKYVNRLPDEVGRHRHLDVIDAARNRADMQIDRSPMIAPDQDPERATAQHQIRRFLERAIDDLPEAFRTVFVMRDIEEATTAETLQHRAS
jgi:hypothetical protein